MEVLSLEGLGPEYRMYRTDNGLHARVKAELKDEAACCFHLSAQVSDENGGEVGPEGPVFILVCSMDQVDLPEMRSPSDEPQKGALAIQEGELFVGDGEAWVSRGPVPAKITAGGAEILAELDKASRRLVTAAERAWGRQSAQGTIKKLIGLL